MQEKNYLDKCLHLFIVLILTECFLRVLINLEAVRGVKSLSSVLVHAPTRLLLALFADIETISLTFRLPLSGFICLCNAFAGLEGSIACSTCTRCCPDHRVCPG